MIRMCVLRLPVIHASVIVYDGVPTLWSSLLNRSNSRCNDRISSRLTAFVKPWRDLREHFNLVVRSVRAPSPATNARTSCCCDQIIDVETRYRLFRNFCAAWRRLADRGWRRLLFDSFRIFAPSTAHCRPTYLAIMKVRLLHHN